MIDSKTLFKVAQVQGHKVNVKYRIMYKNCFDYTSRRNNWILIKLIHRIDVNRTLNVTHCKSQNVKIKHVICDKPRRDLHLLGVNALVIIMTLKTLKNIKKLMMNI